MADVLLLAFDTATAAVTVALHDGESVLAEHSDTDARRHGELLAPAITRVLAEAGRRRSEITDVAVGVGPGPFTGLRVGLVTARSLGDALGVPVHGVCSLDILAAEAVAARRLAAVGAGPLAAAADGESADNASDVTFNAVIGDGAAFAVATDARRREVYWARYAADGRRVTEPAVDRPAAMAAAVAGLPVAGQGPLLYPESFPARLEPALPSARALAELAVRRLSTLHAELLPPLPLYLRRPDAAEPAARKPVSQPALR